MGNRTNVFVEGGVTATYWDSSANGWEWSYEFSDWQGTKRVQANPAGQAENVWQSDPYNDYMTPIVASQDATEHHYTQKERDVESGNDYFGARYYTSLMGRFMSPDWSAKVEPVPYAKVGDPQSLNLYAFVGNNPLTHVDIDGHAPLSWGGFESCGSEFAAIGCGAGSVTAADMAQNVAFNENQAALKNAAAERAQQQSGTVPVIVGQRPIHNLLLRILSLGLAKHSYYIVEGDMVRVLGNPGSSHNQQVRINDSRNDRGNEHTIYVSQAQADALDNGAKLFAQHAGSGLSQSDYANPCPTCSVGQEGYNFLLHNSNSFVYNMLSQDPAGSIPPGSAPAFTPGWAMKPEDWYPNP